MRDIHQQPGPEKYPAKDSPPPFDAPLPVDNTRLQLIYQLLKFEVKLFLDGASDVVFSGLAVGAVILGLIRGGADADRPLRVPAAPRRVLRLQPRARRAAAAPGGALLKPPR